MERCSVADVHPVWYACLQGAVKQVLLSIRSVRTQRNLETFVFDFDYLGVNKMFFASLRDRDTK